MTGHPRDVNDPMSFMGLFDDESAEELEKGWKRLTEDQVPWTGELVCLRFPNSFCGHLPIECLKTPDTFKTLSESFLLIQSTLEIEEALVRSDDRRKNRLLDIGSLSTRVLEG